MIPEVERIEKKSSESFYVGHYRNRWFERTWHYHPEYELILITEGYGTRVIGNQQRPFKAGDLVLIGGNIPHAWFSDPSFFDEQNKAWCESIYVQFDRAIFGNYFSNLPEMKPIQVLLNKARLGLQLQVNQKSEIALEIKSLEHKTGLPRLLSLIEILDLYRSQNYSIILKEDNPSNRFITQSNRLKKVHEYVMKNYGQDIKVSDIAELVGMNVSSFCRYFKRMTQQTFSRYLKDVRIDFAQQLLINTSLSSSQIGFECGFNSVAYFNQCFREISEMSPLEYRSRFKVK